MPYKILANKLPTKTRKEILSYNTKRRNNKSENDEDDVNDMNENDTELANIFCQYMDGLL